MNFDNLAHYDLMKGFICLSRFFWLCSFDYDRSLHYVIHYVKEFKTVSEVRQKWSVKIVNLCKTENVIKRWSELKKKTA